LTYDGFTLSVSGQFLISTVVTVSPTITVGITPIFSFNSLIGSSAFFDYAIRGLSGERRAGVVMAIWDSSLSSVEFTDTSTPDLGGSTKSIELNVVIIGSNVTLQAVVGSSSWSLNTGVRIIV
jgi:hypothetical protein